MARATAPDMPAKVDRATLIPASAIRSDTEKLSGRRSGRNGIGPVGFEVLAAASDIMASFALISVPSNRAMGVGTHCGTRWETRYNFLSNGNDRYWHDVRICRIRSRVASAPACAFNASIPVATEKACACASSAHMRASMTEPVLKLLSSTKLGNDSPVCSAIASVDGSRALAPEIASFASDACD